MKMQTNSRLFASISNAQVKNLTAEVKETIASDFDAHTIKTFSAADMWNIQRHGRNRIQRRYSL